MNNESDGDHYVQGPFEKDEVKIGCDECEVYYKCTGKGFKCKFIPTYQNFEDITESEFNKESDDENKSESGEEIESE